MNCNYISDKTCYLNMDASLEEDEILGVAE